MDYAEVVDSLENKTVKRCIEYGIGEGIAAGWLVKHGEPYLLEKLEIVKQAKQKGEIKTTEAQYLAAAVNNDYKDGQVAIQIQNRAKRKEARLLREAEVEASEKVSREQRERRKEAREAVITYLKSLDEFDAQQLETQFIKETNLNPDEAESFHDWIAEKPGVIEYRMALN